MEKVEGESDAWSLREESGSSLTGSSLLVQDEGSSYARRRQLGVETVSVGKDVWDKAFFKIILARVRSMVAPCDGPLSLRNKTCF